MAADEPPYLTIGTDVSAKYKGAFCEAKVKKVNRVVKCKVTFKNNLGTFMVTDDQIKGPLRIGADVDAKHPEKNQFSEAVINKLQDYSQYTVVFDDGDETTLRRTSLCLKSGRHFAESPTLDQFPLTNPEHFGTPVIGTSKFKRKRRSTMNSSIDYESSDDESVTRRVKAIRGKEQNPDLGRVVCVDYGDRRKRENWYPGLIYPHPPQSPIKIAKEEHLVRSFKDGKYYQVPKRDIREFTKESIQKVENNSLRIAIEKATNYLEKDELPPNWDKALFASLDTLSGEEDSQETDSDTDDEPTEEKDRFVAQLYKFMDERGTPINKAPCVSNRDLNLYKLFKIMHKLGGYNKVTNKNKWKVVYCKMGLPQSNVNGPNQIKFAYKRFLQSFEDFYRKLGCTMVSNSRSTRGRHRSDRNIIITRTRERETASPKSRGAKEAKEKAPTDKSKPEDKAKPPTDRKEPSKAADETSAPKSEDTKLKTPDKKPQTRPPRSEDAKEEKRRGTLTPKTPEDNKPRLARQTSLTKDRKAPERARTREDARREKVDSPTSEKKTRSSLKKEDTKPLLKEKDKKEEDKPKETKPNANPKKEEKTTPVKDKVALKKEEVKSSSRERKPPLSREKKKEDKEEKPSPKVKKEDESPRRKMPGKDRAPRTQSEEKDGGKGAKTQEKEEPEGKAVKEERPSRAESVTKKDEQPKEKLRVKAKESAPSVDEAVALEDAEEKDAASSLDSFERKPPGPRTEGEDPPSKAKRRSLKLDEKDEKESLLGMSDSDESCTNDSEKNFNKEVKHNDIEIGDRVKVKYGRGRLQKVYEAKVLKIETDGTEKRFYVHYAGWNTRYDEWVKKNYIVAIIYSTKQKPDGTMKTSTSSVKKIDRGRPPGVLANTKPDRKNSTSSGSSSRATRSERKTLLSGGLEAKRRTRRKSGTTTSATDASQESDTDAMDAEDEEDMSSSFKEELFSDDDEKDKLEDAKRSDITELEKAILVEDFEEKAVVKSEGPEEEVENNVRESKTLEEEKSGGQKKMADSPKATLPDVKVSKAQEVGSGYTPSMTDCSISLDRLPPRVSVVSENKAALSFEGLIKKSADFSSTRKPSAVAKEVLPNEKIDPPPDDDKKLVLKNESVSDSSCQPVTIFGSVVSSFQKAIPSPTTEAKTHTKDVGNLFKPITKPEVEEDGIKKLSQVLINKTNMHNTSQNLRVSTEPATSSNSTPTTHSKIAEMKTEKVTNTPNICSTKNLSKLDETKNTIKSDLTPAKLSDIKSPVRLDNAKSAAKLSDSKISALLSDAKNSPRMGDAKNSPKIGDAKSVPRINDSKNSPKMDDPTNSQKLDDVKNTVKPGDVKSTSKVGDSKSTTRLDEPKNTVRLSDTKCTEKLGDTKSMDRLDDSKSRVALSDSKFPARLGDNKGPIRYGDVKNPAKLNDNKSQTEFGDNKDFSKLSDDKSSPKLSDAKSLSKFGETKSVAKSEDTNSSIKIDTVAGTKLGDDKNLPDVKLSTQASDYMSPAKLSDMSSVKLGGASPKLSSIDRPVKRSEINSLAKLKDSNLPTKVSNSNPNDNPSSVLSNTNSSKSRTTNSSVKLSDPNSSVKLCDTENSPKLNSDTKKEDPEIKPKDSFDLLLESGPNFCHNPSKIPDVKDVFNFSFGSHSASKESGTTFPKFTTSDTLCCITPKASETVDVSKIIPGILDRLKKDDVLNSKVLDSPPPPKEELSFDFLRGSQTSSKSLSRSDSSNSLRICESDTNDSNLELKDLSSGNKSETSTIPPDSKPDLKNISKPTSESNLSSSSSSNAYLDIPKDGPTLISQQASVITAATASKEAVPVPVKDHSMVLKEEPKITLNYESVAVKEDVSSKPKNTLDSADNLFPKMSSSLESFSVFGSAVDKGLNEKQLASTVKTEHKESLFDELKSSIEGMKPVSKCEQSSVIKFVSDVAESALPEKIQAAKTLDKESSKSAKEQELVDMKTASDDQDLSVTDSSLGIVKDGTSSSSAAPEKESSVDANIISEESSFSQLNKKDVKRKKLGKKNAKKLGFPESPEKEGKDSKTKEGKIKSKKRLRLEDSDKAKSGLDLKNKSKKIKKNKKRFSRHDDSFGKFEFRDDDLDKTKKRDRKKKFLKSKSEDFSSELKKKKNKKNRPGDKKEFKTKKKRKFQQEDNQDTDSEKDSVKVVDKKRKKKKLRLKECSSSDEEEDFFKNKDSYLRQESSKSDDPDMSFLLCEEKVPASPGGDMAEDTSGAGTSTNEEEEDDDEDLPSVYPSCSRDSKHSVLDNTPPTTPSSTESLLSSSPSHNERDAFPVHYPESTQEGHSMEGDLFHCSGSRTVARASEEYRAATTLAFAVCKQVATEKPSGHLKRTDHSPPPPKRKKKRVQRYPETTKSPKHKSTYARMSKVESYCEDSSGTSPATSSSPTYGNLSSLSFSRTLPHRASSEASSRYFYVPLHEKDPEKRISVLQDKMAALRKKYMALRAEVIAIDHKRRKARKKVRETGGAATNPSVQSEDGHSCS